SCVAFSPDGKRLAWGGFYGEGLWDLEADRSLLKRGGLTVRSVAFSPDGRFLAAGTTTGFVRLRAAGDGRELLGLKAPSAVSGLAFSPKGDRLAAGCEFTTVGPPSQVVVWDTATGKPTLTLYGHRDSVHAVAFSPEGRWIASAAGADLTLSEPGEVRLWDA